MPIEAVARRNTFIQALIEKRNVMAAVMLRDMRSRFFNHGLGFLLVPIWPLAHVALLLTIYTLMNRRAPYGESLYIFFATGLVPTLTFMYTSRFMAVSLLNNKPMLSFPIVQVLDILMARAALEFISGCITVALFLGIMFAMGENPIPFNPPEAAFALLTALLLAVGMGMIVSVIAMFSRGFITIYFISLAAIYISSGTLFVASAMPSEIAVPLSYNPVLQCVEWMRTAYFPGYSERLLDKSYALSIALVLLFTGFLSERLARAKVMES